MAWSLIHFFHSPILLSDDFDDEDLAASWRVVDEGTISAPSDWATTGGRVEQLANIYGPDATTVSNRQGTFLLWDEPPAYAWSNYHCVVTFNSFDDDGAGVMFRYQNASNYYKVEFDNQRSFARLSKKVDGEEFTLARVTGGFNQFTDNFLSVTASSNQLTVMLNGASPFGTALLDDSFPTGTVALYSWASQGLAFDDVFVWPVNYPPVVRINQPLAGASIGGPANLTISIDASDNEDSVTTVDMFADGDPIGFATHFPSELVWSNAPAGIHLLTATATDELGLTSLSVPVQFTITNLDGSPFITLQPLPQLALVGDSVSFGAAALGAEPLAYQWRVNNSAIAGATNATLALTNVQLADTASYSIRVSNFAGTVASRPAPLRVKTVEFGELRLTSAGHFQLEIVGVPGRSYAIEASTNLSNWTPLTTLTNVAASTLFHDPEAVLHPRRFYRVLLQP